MRIHGLIESSTVNGPGKRSVIWFQGCQGMNCPGCWNPETHPAGGGHERSASSILNWLAVCVEDGIEGVTFSGGEPMQQAPALLQLTLAIRELFPHLSMGMFSGYTQRELESGPAAAGGFLARSLWRSMQGLLDFAILGRYNALAPAGDPLVTSTNQKLCLYTQRYTAADFAEQAVEVQIDGEGLTQITGFPVNGGLNA